MSIAKPPNPAVERTAGSHALAAAAHRDRWADVRLTKAWRSVVLRSLTILLLTAFSMAGSACVASREVVRHAHAGTVVDSASGAPIADAATVVESWSVRTPSGGRSKRRDVFRTTTDVAGRFYVSEMKELFFSLPLPDMGPEFQSRICVTKDGYVATVADPWSEGWHSAGFHELPTVLRLTPVRPSDTSRPMTWCPFEADK